MLFRSHLKYWMWSRISSATTKPQTGSRRPVGTYSPRSMPGLRIPAESLTLASEFRLIYGLEYTVFREPLDLTDRAKFVLSFICKELFNLWLLILALPLIKWVSLGWTFDLSLDACGQCLEFRVSMLFYLSFRFFLTVGRFLPFTDKGGRV